MYVYLKFTKKVFVFRNKYYIKAKILKAIQNFGKEYINSQYIYMR